MSAGTGSPVIGIDISSAFASGIRGAVVDRDARVVAVKEAITPRGLDDLVAAVSTMVGRLGEAAQRNGAAPSAVAIATPGPVDEGTGVVHNAPNLRLREVRLGPLLQERVGLPVLLVHDAGAAAVAENLLGAGRGVSDLMLVVVGTGVGSAAVSGGRVVRGAHGTAGEIGHISVDASGLPCGCGGRGCVETFASEPALTRRYTMAAREALSADQVIARAIAGQPEAARVWNQALSALAFVLASAVAIIDCELIVLCGTMNIPAAGVAPLRSLLAQRLSMVAPPRIEVGALGADTGVLGAAAHAFESAGMGGVVEAWREQPLRMVPGAA